MLGIVILNYKSWREVISCVESVRTCSLNVLIVIVDNNSPDESFSELQMIYKDIPNIIAVKSITNGGYSAGNNIGINICIDKGIKYCVVANPDVIFDIGALEGLYNAIQLPNVVIAGPQIFDTYGNLIGLPFIERQSMIEYIGFNFKTRRIISVKDIKLITGEYKQVYMVSGCCFAVDIGLFKQMGAFDEGAFLYNEEGILSIQAQRCNFKIIYCPGVKIVHNHRTSTRRESLFIETKLLCSGLYYWREYEKVSKPLLILLFVGMRIRVFVKILLRKTSPVGYVKYARETIDALLKQLYPNSTI